MSESKGVLEYVGFQFDQRSNMEKPHFKKKDGSGVWGMNPGPVNWQQFQPPCKLYVAWENFTAISATTNIPEGGGRKGPWKAQPYHPETFVSNVVGQAIQAGLIKQPGDVSQWASQAFSVITSLQGSTQQSAPQNAPQQASAQQYSQASGGGYPGNQ